MGINSYIITPSELKLGLSASLGSLTVGFLSQSQIVSNPRWEERRKRAYHQKTNLLTGLRSVSLPLIHLGKELQREQGLQMQETDNGHNAPILDRGARRTEHGWPMLTRLLTQRGNAHYTRSEQRKIIPHRWAFIFNPKRVITQKIRTSTISQVIISDDPGWITASRWIRKWRATLIQIGIIFSETELRIGSFPLTFREGVMWCNISKRE